MPKLKNSTKEKSKREAYTTSIDADLQRRFKIFCATHGKYQNEVLEELLTNLLDKEGGDNGNTN